MRSTLDLRYFEFAASTILNDLSMYFVFSNSVAYRSNSYVPLSFSPALKMIACIIGCL